MIKPLLDYFAAIKYGKIVLWCYLIWYFVTLYYHFDLSPKIWLNSIGISVVIGYGLLLSVAASPVKNHWQTARLFIMPFCVSSFSALIKGQGFVLIFSSDLQELSVAILCCGTFIICVSIIKYFMNIATYKS